MGISHTRIELGADNEAVWNSTSEDSRFPKRTSVQSNTILPQDVFLSMLTIERRRAERSRKPFVLMLLDTYLANGSGTGILRQAIEVLAHSKRETDLMGWYTTGSIVGVIFSEL